MIKSRAIRRRLIKGLIISIPIVLYCLLVIQERACAQNIDIPRITIEPGGGEGDIPLSLQILFLLTILSLAPSILIMMTSFTRIVIVLSLVRNALGTQQLPPNPVLVGLALFLTFFVMAPVLKDMNQNALQPYLKGDIKFQDGLKKAEVSIRDFMRKQTRRKDLALMINLSKIEKPGTMDDVPTYVLIPAFVISELKTAFQMGFVIYIPFLIIDMVVASTLMSMGMLFLPPILISLPFKILLFVMTDGWYLITGSLVTSFN
jgi:flagellar biosynthetic protein FliP